MKLLPEGLAGTYYDKILQIHFNHGTQTKEQKVTEYKDILDKILPHIKGPARKKINGKITEIEATGINYIHAQKRNNLNHNGAFSQRMVSSIDMLLAIRNDIEHEKVVIDYDEYIFCVKTIAKTIGYFSEVPILNEVREIYETIHPATMGGTKPKLSTDPQPKVQANKKSDANFPQGLHYVESPEGIIITGYKGNETNIVIPDTINAMKIIQISEGAFQGTTIEEITLPNTITEIKKEAFAGCLWLKQLKVSNSSAPSHSPASPGEANLPRIIFPDQLREIGDSAFYECKNLHSVIVFPKGLRKIGESAFYGCEHIYSVSFPRNIEYIYSYAFDGCYNVNTVIGPDKFDGYYNQIDEYKPIFENHDNIKFIYID